MKNNGPKILAFDIETAPYEAYIWGPKTEYVSTSMFQKDRCILSYAAKWVGDSRMYYADQRGAKDIRDDKKLVSGLAKLIDQADILLTKNGKRFDVKVMNGRLAVHRLSPPSPYKHIDVEQLFRKHFDLPSYSLDYLSHTFGTKHKKLKHSKYPGIDLWRACLARDKAAWREMEKYNRADVLATEELYEVIRPWGSNVDLSAYFDKSDVRCRECGSHDLQSRGPVAGSQGKKHRLLCKTCGAWNTVKVNQRRSA